MAEPVTDLEADEVSGEAVEAVAEETPEEDVESAVEEAEVPEEVKHWSLTTLREKLVKIGAKVVQHGRYVTFQLAEVAVPRDLLADILDHIDRLRPRPVQT